MTFKNTVDLQIPECTVVWCGKMCSANLITQKKRGRQIEKDVKTCIQNSCTTLNDNQKSSTTPKAKKRKRNDQNPTVTENVKKMKIAGEKNMNLKTSAQSSSTTPKNKKKKVAGKNMNLGPSDQSSTTPKKKKRRGRKKKNIGVPAFGKKKNQKIDKPADWKRFGESGDLELDAIVNRLCAFEKKFNFEKAALKIPTVPHTLENLTTSSSTTATNPRTASPNPVLSSTQNSNPATTSIPSEALISSPSSSSIKSSESKKQNIGVPAKKKNFRKSRDLELDAIVYRLCAFEKRFNFEIAALKTPTVPHPPENLTASRSTTATNPGTASPNPVLSSTQNSNLATTSIPSEALLSSPSSSSIKSSETTLMRRNSWQTSTFDMKNNFTFPISGSILGNFGKMIESSLEVEEREEGYNPFPQELHNIVPSVNSNPEAFVQEEIIENLKPAEEREEISYFSSPRMIFSDIEIDLICSGLLCLHEKKIILLLNYNGKMNCRNFIEESLKFSGFTKLFCTSRQICSSLWVSSLVAELKKNDSTIISVAYGRTENLANNDAVEYILGFLLKCCFVIFVKKPICTEVIQLESLFSSKPAEERSKSIPVIDLTEDPVESASVTLMLLHSPFYHNVNSLLEDMNRRILNNEFVPDMEFSLDLSLQQTGNIRRIVHEKYNETLEATYQYNKYLRGENLVISAKWNNMSLFRHLLRNGGSTNKYHLYYPNTLSMTSLFSLFELI